jgi:hypothetical protein
MPQLRFTHDKSHKDFALKPVLRYEKGATDRLNGAQFVYFVQRQNTRICQAANQQKHQKLQLIIL